MKNPVVKTNSAITRFAAVVALISLSIPCEVTGGNVSDHGFDQSQTKSDRQNTCGTSTAGCSNTATYICQCQSCPSEGTSCPCSQTTGQCYQEVYPGSCVTCSASASVSWPSFKVEVGTTWYICSCSDATSGTYVNDLTCTDYLSP